MEAHPTIFGKCHAPREDAGKRLGDWYAEPDAREATVEIDMSIPLATATFDTRAAYAARVDQKTSRSAARRDGSSREAEDGWVLDRRWEIWTMGGPSVGQPVPRPRENMEIRGVYSDSRGNGSSAGIRLRFLGMP